MCCTCWGSLFADALMNLGHFVYVWKQVLRVLIRVWVILTGNLIPGCVGSWVWLLRRVRSAWGIRICVDRNIYFPKQ